MDRAMAANNFNTFPLSLTGSATTNNINVFNIILSPTNQEGTPKALPASTSSHDNRAVSDGWRLSTPFSVFNTAAEFIKWYEAPESVSNQMSRTQRVWLCGAVARDPSLTDWNTCSQMFFQRFDEKRDEESLRTYYYQLWGRRAAAEGKAMSIPENAVADIQKTKVGPVIEAALAPAPVADITEQRVVASLEEPKPTIEIAPVKRLLPRTVFTAKFTDQVVVQQAMVKMRTAAGHKAPGSFVSTNEKSVPQLVALLASLLSIPTNRDVRIYCPSLWAIHCCAVRNYETGYYEWIRAGTNFSCQSCTGSTCWTKHAVHEILITVEKRLELGSKTYLDFAELKDDEDSKEIDG